MSLILRAAAVTDAGFGRESNEDAVYAGPSLVAVADGMGGLPAGEVASDIVIRALGELASTPPVDAPALDALREAVEAANQRIRDAVIADPELDGMGTTLTALMLAGDRITMAHVGDSRAYLLRDAELTRLTKDDTYVQQLVDRGVISAEQATTHPHRSVVTRAVRGRPVSPTFTVLRAHAGDRLLVCSDGLSDVVSDAAIARTLREVADAQRCAAQLVELALQAGGPDNISTVVADAVPG